MYSCDHEGTCEFFRLAGYSPELNNLLKERYCRSGCENCARFLALAVVGRDRVPPAMLPTEYDQVARLLST